VHGTLANGRPFRVLTVVDNWSRRSPMLEVGFRMSGSTVWQALDRTLPGVSGPRSITVDHGTEFQSRALEDWSYRWGVQLDFSRPGNRWKMRSLSRLTGLQDACLNVHQFMLLDDSRAIIETWRVDYNHHRQQTRSASGRRTSLLHNVRPKESSAPVKNCLVTRPTSLPENSPLKPSQIGGSVQCL
jgi:putative transposase